jgi:hypothetical protein
VQVSIHRRSREVDGRLAQPPHASEASGRPEADSTDHRRHPQQLVVPDGGQLYANQPLDYTGLTLEENEEGVGANSFIRTIRVRDERHLALAQNPSVKTPSAGTGEYRWFIIRYKPLRMTGARPVVLCGEPTVKSGS